MQETQIQSLDQEDPLEEEMATHSSILAWKKFMDRGAWWATVPGEPKSLTQLRSMKLKHTTILTEAIRCTHSMQHGWIIKTNYLGGKKINIKNT